MVDGDGKPGPWCFFATPPGIVGSFLSLREWGLPGKDYAVQLEVTLSLVSRSCRGQGSTVHGAARSRRLDGPQGKNCRGGLPGRWVTWDRAAIHKCLNKKLFEQKVNRSNLTIRCYMFSKKENSDLYSQNMFWCFWLHLT